MKIESGAVCFMCEQGVFHQSEVARVVKFEGRTRKVSGLKLLECDVCGEGFYDKASDEKMDLAFVDLKRGQRPPVK